MSNQDFDRQLGALLRDTASDIDAHADVAPRVRQQLASNGGRLGSRQWLAVASMVAIVALLVGTFAWFKSGQLGSHPVNSGGIELHLDAAYADANTTTLEYHITGPHHDDKNTHVVYTLSFPTLTSARGTSLREASSCTPPPFSTSQCIQFAPLPANELGSRETLTLTETRIEMTEIPLQLVGNPPTPPASTIITGSWRASIEVTPSTGASQTLHVAAQTNGGISIQPLRLDSWPRSVRIVVRIGGLTPGSQESPIFITTTTQPDAGGKVTLTSASASAATEDQRSPDNVYLLDPAGNPVQGPYTIPASGTLDIELIFSQPPRGDVSLMFDSISLQKGTSSPAIISGPWNFYLTIPR